jgi:hypothetical protein
MVRVHVPIEPCKQVYTILVKLLTIIFPTIRFDGMHIIATLSASDSLYLSVTVRGRTTSSQIGSSLFVILYMHNFLLGF